MPIAQYVGDGSIFPFSATTAITTIAGSTAILSATTVKTSMSGRTGDQNQARQLKTGLVLQEGENKKITEELFRFLYAPGNIRARLRRPCRTPHILCHHTVLDALFYGSDDRCSSLVLSDMIEQQ
jgi:hypothetical protein